MKTSKKEEPKREAPLYADKLAILHMIYGAFGSCNASVVKEHYNQAISFLLEG